MATHSLETCYSFFFPPLQWPHFQARILGLNGRAAQACCSVWHEAEVIASIPASLRVQGKQMQSNLLSYYKPAVLFC